MPAKNANFVTNEIEILSLLVGTYLKTHKHVITHMSPLITGADELSGVLTHHYSEENPNDKREVLWVFDTDKRCICGYVRTTDNYRSGWVECEWAAEFLKIYNQYVSVAFSDFFAAVKERKMGYPVKKTLSAAV